MSTEPSMLSNKLFKLENLNYKYLIYIAMLYLTIKFIITIMVYTTVTVLGYVASISIFITPLWFLLGDVITEVYGYRISIKLIYASLICQFLFTVTCAVLSHVAVINGATNNPSTFFSLLPRISIASIVGTLGGGFVNSYIVAKYKIILKGKHFWWRSLCATVVGEIFYTITTASIAFIGIKPIDVICQLIVTSSIVKFIANPILVIPTALLAYFLDKYEKQSKSFN